MVRQLGHFREDAYAVRTAIGDDNPMILQVDPQARWSLADGDLAQDMATADVEDTDAIAGQVGDEGKAGSRVDGGGDGLPAHRDGADGMARTGIDESRRVGLLLGDDGEASRPVKSDVVRVIG